MKSRYNKFNPKRKIIKVGDVDGQQLEKLAISVSYGGNPEHKRNPGDFGLTPPSDPRQGKSLCDVAKIFSRKDALKLLKKGVRLGLVSERIVEGWPQNIWSVSDSGMALEAQLENAQRGSYHGYPMPDSDPLASDVLSRWGDGNV